MGASSSLSTYKEFSLQISVIYQPCDYCTYALRFPTELSIRCTKAYALFPGEIAFYNYVVPHAFGAGRIWLDELGFDALGLRGDVGVHAESDSVRKSARTDKLRPYKGNCKQ